MTLLFPPIMLHIMMLLAGLSRKIMIPVLSVFYIEFVFFIYRNFNVKLLYKNFIRVNGYWNFIKADTGIVPALYVGSFIMIFFISLALLIKWRKETDSKREKKQAMVLFFSMGLLLLFLFMDFVIYNHFSDRDLGLSVHYLFIWPFGIGIAVVKYGFLSFTPRLFAYDIFENIDEYLLVLDNRKKIILMNKNAKKIISGYLNGPDIRKVVSGYDEITGNIDKIYKGIIDSFTADVVFIMNHNSRLAISVKFSCIKDSYNDRVGVLIIGRELKGIKEFAAEYRITDRELEVITSIMTGLTNREIAAMLKITERTVKSHILNIHDKLDVRNKVELINLLKRHNIT